MEENASKTAPPRIARFARTTPRRNEAQRRNEAPHANVIRSGTALTIDLRVKKNVARHRRFEKTLKDTRNALCRFAGGRARAFGQDTSAPTPSRRHLFVPLRLRKLGGFAVGAMT